jgi:hypothetical protein
VTDAHSAPSEVTGLDRFLRIFIVFVLAGPPLGFVVLTLGFFLQKGTSVRFVELPAVLTKLLPGLPFAYLFGILPAAAAGALIGAYKVAKGHVPWWVAFAIGTIVGVVFLYFMDRPRSPSAASNATDSGMKVLLILTNLLPTMLCWLIVRNWYTTSAQSSDA